MSTTALPTFDILVIGGGPAGYSAAIHARHQPPSQQGQPPSVVLVEARQLGGTCLNRGCIPTKTLLETAHILDHFAEAASRGIAWDGTATLIPSKVYQYKDRIVKRLSAGMGMLLRENGISVFQATATLDYDVTNQAFPFKATLQASDGSELPPVLAKKVILATGSVPTRIPVPGMDHPDLADRIITSDEILDATMMPDSLRENLPSSLAILGGGIIGVEASRIFRAFGAEVHIIEALPRLAAALDEDISEALTKDLKSQKVKISLNKKLERVQPRAVPPNEGGIELLFSDGESAMASHLLVAVGRSPKNDVLSEKLRATLKLDRRGFVEANDQMQTSLPGLYVIGDLNGKCLLAHAAMEMGRIAAKNIVDELLFAPNATKSEDAATFCSFLVPSCIYGTPETASIGLTEAAARQKYGDEVRIGRFPMAANSRASATGIRDGFVKVMRQEGTNALLGVHIVGPCASELINEAATLLMAGGNVEQWALAVHGHPTFGESLVEAAADSFGLALNLPPTSRTS